jgi:hypothetical protein
LATFRDLLEHWMLHVGSHQLPLDWRSRAAPDVVCSEAVHYDVMRELVHELYATNGCGSPEHPVSLSATLDALGRTRARTCSRRRVDIEAVALVERLGELAVLWLHEERPDPEAGICDRDHGDRREHGTDSGIGFRK